MSDAQAACHPDCLAMIEDTDARNTMLLQANHGGGAGRDPYSAADGGLMSVRIFLQNTVCEPGHIYTLPLCGHGGVAVTLLIGCCVIWLCIVEGCQRRWSARSARRVRREPPLL